MRRLAPTLLLAALAGCSSSPASTPQPGIGTAADALTAGSVLAILSADNLGITNGAVQDENTDPNNLLGRPSGYLSRASFDLPGADPAGDKYTVDRGGAVEVFSTTAGAQTRMKYLQAIVAGGAVLGTEYDYMKGPVLVRVTGKIKPSAVKPFEAATAALPA